jgi:hypothetical protein
MSLFLFAASPISAELFLLSGKKKRGDVAAYFEW